MTILMWRAPVDRLLVPETGELGFVMSGSDLLQLYEPDGRNDETLPLHREHLQIRRRTLREGDPETLLLEAALTTRYLWQGLDAEAEALESSLAVVQPRPPTEEADLRAVEWGEQVRLYVGNLTSHDVTINWLDGEEERQRQGSVEPGRMEPFDTYIGLPQVVTGPDDKAIAVYLPEPGGSLALVR